MATRIPKLVTGYLKMWPRELFNIHKRNKLILNVPELSSQLQILWKSGVYFLYRDEHPYYVGQASGTLFSRLHDHANKSTDAYFNFWNSFSAFAVPRGHLGEVEAILIAAMPTANSSKPWYKPVPLPKMIVKILAERRRIDAEHPGLATQLDPGDFLARARDLRERLPRVLLTEKDIRVAKKKGRP